MYRVMLVDDERTIRNLLKIKVKWEQLGFKVVGEASSGIEAINTIDEIMPNVMFVDIRMPFMDGIELSKIVIKRYPHIKIVILTAFDEFDYAKKCIGIGVSDYILKPINRTEINKVLVKLKNQLEKEILIDDMPILKVDEGEGIEEIKEYILNNYTDPEINLSLVALEFGFNASYLSRMFKEEVGISFIDFLTGCRMEKAISLADEKKYMYQIAKEVGIPDPNYFGKCFKKYTGKSYSEFVRENNEPKY